MDKLISVLVPVYNGEKYIEKCIYSIINQTYSNIEIIVINDGSKDNTLNILNSIRDKRLKVVTQENSGLATTRNNLIKLAGGEFITFIDSDDYVSKNYIEYMFKSLKTSDSVSVCSQINVSDDNCNFPEENISYDTISSLKAMTNIFYQAKSYNTSAWGKLIPLKYFSNVNFPDGKIYEDFATLYKAVLKADAVSVVNNRLYAYRDNPNGIMAGNFNYKDMIYICENIANDILNYKNKYLNRALYSRVFEMIYYVKKNCLVEDDLKNKVNQYIKMYRKYALIYSPRLKTKIKALMAYLNL